MLQLLEIQVKFIQPTKSSFISTKNGANSVTIHLREDRRHINELDLKIIKKFKNTIKS